MFGHGILASNGPAWAQQRKVIAPEFFLDKVKVGLARLLFFFFLNFCVCVCVHNSKLLMSSNNLVFQLVFVKIKIGFFFFWV